MTICGILARMAKGFARLTFLLAICAAPLADAALGGDAQSVQADAESISAQRRVLSLVQYDVQSLEIPGLGQVREYLTRDGIVFAVSWESLAPPNLYMLLGSHYEEYAAAVSAQPHLGLHRNVSIRGQQFVIEQSGHLRAYRGRAYLPALLPSGFALSNLR